MKPWWRQWMDNNQQAAKDVGRSAIQYTRPNLTELKRTMLGNYRLPWWQRMLRSGAHLADLLLLPEWFDWATRLLKPNTRPLSAIELQEAKKVFGDSLPYERIRMDERSLVAKMGAWRMGARQLGVSLFYTIRFTRSLQSAAGNADMGWLIHELVHVAQMHHLGCRYIFEAVHAQYTDGYDYGAPHHLQNKRFADFNREQQGDIVQHYYLYVLYGHLRAASPQYYRADYYEPMIGELRSGLL